MEDPAAPRLPSPRIHGNDRNDHHDNDDPLVVEQQPQPQPQPDDDNWSLASADELPENDNNTDDTNNNNTNNNANTMDLLWQQQQQAARASNDATQRRRLAAARFSKAYGWMSLVGALVAILTTTTSHHHNSGNPPPAMEPPPPPHHLLHPTPSSSSPDSVETAIPNGGQWSPSSLRTTAPPSRRKLSVLSAAWKSPRPSLDNAHRQTTPTNPTNPHSNHNNHNNNHKNQNAVHHWPAWLKRIMMVPSQEKDQQPQQQPQQSGTNTKQPLDPTTCDKDGTCPAKVDQHHHRSSEQQQPGEGWWQWWWPLGGGGTGGNVVKNNKNSKQEPTVVEPFQPKLMLDHFWWLPAPVQQMMDVLCTSPLTNVMAAAAEWVALQIHPHRTTTTSTLGERTSTTTTSIWSHYFFQLDPTLLEPSANTLTDLIDKCLTSTPRLLAIANFLLALTYLLHTAVANWFLGGSSSSSSNHNNNNNNGANTAGIDGISTMNNNHHHAIMEHGREKMGGFLVFKLLLISAVVAPDTLDLLILLSWYTLLSFLRSLAHLCANSIQHASAAGQAPAPGSFRLLLIVLACNVLAAAACVGLFYAAGLGMVVLLTCDCALTAVDVIANMFQHVQAVLEVHQATRIEGLEEEEMALRGRRQQQQQPPPANDASDGSERDDNNNNDDNTAAAVETENEDQQSTSQPGDELEEIEGRIQYLERRHSRRVAILETAIFAFQLLGHLLTVAHFLHIWSLHGIQFTLIDGVLALHLHSAISSASRKIAQRRNLHRIARDLDGVFEDATELELRKASAAGDVCCVCLCSLQGHVKKVACGHLFHTHCLREVVERARSMEAGRCPLCRAGLLDGHHHPTGDGNNTNNGERGVGGDAGDENANNPDQPQVEDQALFRISTDGLVPSWIPIPNFSFEVVRRGAPPLPLNDDSEDDVGANDNDAAGGAAAAAAAPAAQPAAPAAEPPEQQSLLQRLLVMAGALSMSPEEERAAMEQLVDMFPQYDRSDLLRELRDRGSPTIVAESILSGSFTGTPR